ncbi:MAG: hypothetical protein A3H70_00835 [Candidatus Komeilibacteria bacterium RIFCSPLOWO2_02_FULL_48_11]|uniref:Uncharacterized protein n=1 Tax=Candidatus Komeilibacteria bacterium RIFCSPLOWO2_02_FULL_48_11 TaxID=1798553 RepID=A0A1G2BU98_9BACT|nr:MAG: hypothetical protein A3H70_00835 [Candidatus Komeilibacteria bacterium RIFCSPLOWO2_02_FULL_48_11]
MQKLDIKKLGWVLSIFGVVAFVVHYVWYYLVDAALRGDYLKWLKMCFFGFSGMNANSFIVALVQAFVWGWIVAWVFGAVWNKVNKS